MSGFLDAMAAASHQRLAQARQQEPFGALERRAQAMPPAPPLHLSAGGFDVIAELKLRSPAQGALGSVHDDWQGRVRSYAQGGAAAVSVLTEPSRFDGSLEHLQRASEILAPLGVPAMRKDFLVDPYQLLEARVAGAGGALLIVRMLEPGRIAEMLQVAAVHGLFILLEAFDEEDLMTAQQVLGAHAARLRPSPAPSAPVLLGVNCRDLQTLNVVPERFETLAAKLPVSWPAVAESGVASAADAIRMQRLGFRLALIGTALMSRDDPKQFLQEIFAATRTVQF
jgi:indole-3-glycerol phosphate synthase